MDGLTTPLNPAYLSVMDALKDDSRYQTWTVYDFYIKNQGKADGDKVNVIVRIDVDSAFHLAPALASALAERDICASHYFLTHPDRYYKIWGSGIPKQVANIPGQEVGLHSDHYYEQLTRSIDAIAAIKKDIERLSHEASTPIKGMVYHGHPAINAKNVRNRDIYLDISPEEFNLSYHDGDMGPYTAPGTRLNWQPKCDVRFSDFCGYPNSYGWSYWPNRPLRVLQRMQPGQVLHLTFHTQNAFKYWINWDTSFGEAVQYQESLALFGKKKIGSMTKMMITPFLKKLAKKVVSSCLTFTSLFLAKGVGLFFRAWAEPDPYQDWALHNDSIWQLGLPYWERHLQQLGIDWHDRNVLEIGSGPGQWLAVMAQTAKQVSGIDVNPAMLAWARKEFKKNNIHGILLQEGAAESLPTQTASQDIVLCLGVLQFTDQQKTIQEISRVLCPGGKAFVSTNGFGYFLMRLKMGIGNQDPKRVRQGINGLINGITQKVGSKPTTVKRFQALASYAGLTLVETRLWLPRNLYSLDYIGLPTNYLFVLEKESKCEQ